MNKQLKFIFLTDIFDKHQVDVDYAEEYLAAKTHFQVGIVDQDKLFNEDKAYFIPPLLPNDIVVYRGWMLKPGQYRILDDAVTRAGARLWTSSEAYEHTHLLPNWLDDTTLRVHTEWTSDLSDESLIQLLGKFNGPVTIKDFVKSRKFEWDEAFFVPDVSDIGHALHVIHTFIERQGDDLVGGIVMREYVELHAIGTHPKSGTPIFEEYRVFYWQNQPFVVIDYWKNEVVELSEADKAIIESTAQTVASPFFTIDYARASDDSLIVMEMGDGQVSGLQDYNEEAFYELLAERIFKTGLRG
jgi:hypothetical protein